MSCSEKFFDDVGIRGELVSRFPDSPQIPPLKTAPFNSLRPPLGLLFTVRHTSFWCYGAYKNIRDRMELITGFAAVTVLPAGTVGRGHP